MPLYCGLDRSGTPDPKERRAGRELYVTGFAAVPVDVEIVRSALTDLRHECGMAATQEFHGRSCPEWIQTKVLNTAQDLGLRVAVSIYEKVQATPGSHSHENAAHFQSRVALELLERFVQQHQLARLWCDEDIQGKVQQKAFETAAEQCHRLAWPDTRMRARHIASKSSDLVQLADIVVYGFSRLFREAINDADLQRCLRAIRGNPENIVIGPLPWEK